MDSQYWLHLILAGIVGYVIAIVANIHTPRLKHFLDSRKLLRTYKTRQQVLQAFNRIKQFREGKRDRYAFYILLAGTSVVCAITASTIIILTVSQKELPLAMPLEIPLLLAVMASLVALILLIGIYNTARNIERFDDYKEEVEKHWGLLMKRKSRHSPDGAPA